MEQDLGPLFALHKWIASEIAEHCPGLVSAQHEFGELGRLLGNRLTVQIPSDGKEAIDAARNRVINQLVNDFLDLLYESLTGRGRPAMRAARSLYEHAINLATVSVDPSQAERFMQHVPAVEMQISRLDFSKLRVMDGKQLRRVRHRQKKSARAAKPAATGAEGSWTKSNLRDRSALADLDGDYDFFRVASAVMHGSAGGTLGTFGQVESGATLFRTGPALSICPLALAYGLYFVERALPFVEDEEAASLWLGFLQEVRSIWVDYSEVIASIDSHLWPPASPLVVVARVLTTGNLQWWIHDRERGQVALAPEPTKVPEFALETVGRVLASPNFGSEPVTVAVVGVPPKVPADAQWVPESQILVQRPLYVGEPPAWMTSAPRLIPDDEPFL